MKEANNDILLIHFLCICSSPHFAAVVEQENKTIVININPLCTLSWWFASPLDKTTKYFILLTLFLWKLWQTTTTSSEEASKARADFRGEVCHWIAEVEWSSFCAPPPQLRVRFDRSNRQADLERSDTGWNVAARCRPWMYRCHAAQVLVRGYDPVFGQFKRWVGWIKKDQRCRLSQFCSLLCNIYCAFHRTKTEVRVSSSSSLHVRAVTLVLNAIACFYCLCDLCFLFLLCIGCLLVCSFVLGSFGFLVL